MSESYSDGSGCGPGHDVKQKLNGAILWTIPVRVGMCTGCGEKGRQIDGKGTKIAGGAAVTVRGMRGRACGEYLLNKNGQNSKNGHNSEGIYKNFPKLHKIVI